MIRHILPLLSNIYWWYNHDPHINITVMYQHAVCVKYNSAIKSHSTHSLYDSNNHDYDICGRIFCLRFGHRWVWTTMSHPEKTWGWTWCLWHCGPISRATCSMYSYRAVPYGTVRHSTVPYGTVRYRWTPYAAPSGTIRGGPPIAWGWVDKMPPPPVRWRVDTITYPNLHMYIHIYIYIHI